MVQKEYEIPTNKRKPTILFVVMLAVSMVLLLVSSISFYDTSQPRELEQISCEFYTYETRNRTRSISYDLLLFSEEYDKPFELDFFDGYKKRFAPETFCSGNTYVLWVLPCESSYVIYGCFDTDGNLVMSKREAYINSQGTAHFLLCIFLLISICWWLLLILIMYYPEKFGDRVKSLFFGKRKSK